MEQDNKKGLVTAIVVVIIVIVGGYLLYTQGGTGGAGESPKTAVTPEPALAPQLELTPRERAGDVGDKKADILELVRSGKPLTPEQKAEIGGIMLTKAHIYQFSEPERVKIFEALQR